MADVVERGDLVQDIVTGYKGIVTAITVRTNGNRKAQVQPQELFEGKPIEPFQFDFEDLTVLKQQAVKPTPVTYDGPIVLGDEVKEASGYQGIVEGIRTSLPGCVEFIVYAHKLDKEGLPSTGISRHSSEFTLVKKAVKEPVAAKKQTGATAPARDAR